MAALDYAYLLTACHAHGYYLSHIARRSCRRASPPSGLPCAITRSASYGLEASVPTWFEHVFASIQSLTATGSDDLPPDYFDLVIVDEFHHAAAKSYTSLLSHVQPVELLGLTATPERTDGLSLLHWFDGRIAAELRLWDAIEQHRLCSVRLLRPSRWHGFARCSLERGRGYDAEGLTNVLTANDARAHLVAKQLREHVGRCVENARTRLLRQRQACALYGPGVQHDRHPFSRGFGRDRSAEREQALRDLDAGRISLVFSVDLFNEGVDIPSVDTLLLFVRTESPTLFLQQLGRGLRKHRAKSVCTVLDFVGHHRKEFRFDQRFRALLGGSRADVMEQIKEGFPFLPAGCHMQLDRVAQTSCLKALSEPYQAGGPRRSKSCGQCERTTGRNARRLSRASGWSWRIPMKAIAPGPTFAKQPASPSRGRTREAKLRRACGRLLHIDDLTHRHVSTLLSSVHRTDHSRRTINDSCACSCRQSQS